MSAENLARLEELADQLDPYEQQQLIVRLSLRLLERPTGKRRSLRGIWAGHFPDDFDVDSALKEIRSAWKHRIEDIERE